MPSSPGAASYYVDGRSGLDTADVVHTLPVIVVSRYSVDRGAALPGDANLQIEGPSGVLLKVSRSEGPVRPRLVSSI